MLTPEGAATRIRVTAKAWQQILPSHLTGYVVSGSKGASSVPTIAYESVSDK